MVVCFNLSPGSGGGMGGCSLKVHRGLTLYRTLVRRPGVLLLSRPAGTLSRRDVSLFHRHVLRRGGGSAVAVLADRGGRSVRVLTSRGVYVRFNGVGRLVW